MDFKKKEPLVVLVTGGSRGIGRALCTAFASPEKIIYFNYLSSEKEALETEKAIKESGARGFGLQFDISDEKQVPKFFKQIIKETGRLDILVNNAGIAKDNLLVRMSYEDWDSVINTNLKGTFNCMKAAARPMIRQKFGRIINIVSVVGITGNRGQSNYAASKAGIIGLTKTAAKELCSRGITVNAVAPGFIDTDMTGLLPDKEKQAIIEKIPLGRVGTPEDVAGVVLFLASEAGSYITGQVINVDGGMYI